MNANRIVLFFAVIVCIFSYGMAYSTRCFQAIETGPCRRSEIRFAYDSEKQQCVKFTYGGCKGNENNFLTLQECWEQCVIPDTE